MKIDRARALMFVGLLAASGCVITTEDDDDDGNGEAGAPDTGGRTGTGGKSSTGGSDQGGAAGEGPSGAAGERADGGATSGTGGAAGSGDAGSGGEESASGGQTSAGGATPTGGKASTGGAPGTGGTNAAGAGGEGGDGGLICDDSQGELPGCADIAPAPACESIGDFQRGNCESAATNFKPRIAAEIQYCITLQTPEELCDADLTNACADEVIRSSCPDDAAAVEACTEIALSCEAVDLDDCLIYLSAMSATGKSETVACMVEGLWCDLYSCVEGL